MTVMMLKLVQPQEKKNKRKTQRKIKQSKKEMTYKRKTQLKKTTQHREWTQPKKKAVIKDLGSFIRDEKVPGKLACEKCKINAKGALDRREWRAIKYYVKNQINKRKKKSS